MTSAPSGPAAEIAAHPRLDGVTVLRISQLPRVWPAALSRPRDRELARMCARGLSIAEMADHCGVAAQTMTNELAVLYRRLGAFDRNAFLAALYEGEGRDG